jgi:hypothetical protein
MAKPKAKPRLTDAERHERFVAMAREVEAEDSAKAFDDAFRRVAAPPSSKTPPS